VPARVGSFHTPGFFDAAPGRPRTDDSLRDLPAMTGGEGISSELRRSV
jgi:hypothetical protein